MKRVTNRTLVQTVPKTALSYRPNPNKPGGPNDRVWTRGECSLYIDYNALMDRLAQKALTNKTGVATAMRGAIQVHSAQRVETVEERVGRPVKAEVPL